MKKILFLISTLSGGGAEKVLVNLVNNLNSEKYDITVQTIWDIGKHKKNLNENIRYKSLNSANNSILKRLKGYLILKFLPLSWVYRQYIDDNYDIEVAFLEGIPTKILSASNNLNKYAWVHTDLMNYYDGQIKVFGSIFNNAQIYKNYKKIIAVSQSVKKAFKKRFGFDDNVIVIHNPIDKKNIIQLSKENIIEIEIPYKMKLVTVGRLCEQKGYDRLIEVAAKLRDDGFDFVLWIIGDGLEKDNLHELIAKYELKDYVKLLGFCDNPYKFMRAADLFVCSSRAEGFSLVVAEAMICQTPVISTDCAGPDELLEGQKYGVLVENDTQALYEGIKRIITDSELLEHYKKMAKERGEQFSLEDTVKTVERLFI